MKKVSVILPPGRAQFRRVIRGEDGKALLDKGGAERVLLFNPGQVVELTAEEVEAVRDDIGNTLYIAKADKDAKPVAKPDGNATRKFAEETKELRAMQQAERNAAKVNPEPKPPVVHHAAKKDLEKK